MPLKQSGSALLLVILAVVIIAGGGFVVYKADLLNNFVSGPQPNPSVIPATKPEILGPSLKLSSDKDTKELKNGESFIVSASV
jgi:hypothetical protein